jgi:hypothetical protein
MLLSPRIIFSFPNQTVHPRNRVTQTALQSHLSPNLLLESSSQRLSFANGMIACGYINSGEKNAVFLQNHVCIYNVLLGDFRDAT